MDNGRFLNQRLIINEQQIRDTRFVVVGAGAIGSATVVNLSKMGMRNCEVYDFDRLEDHNFANQMYPVDQLGQFKVDALKLVAKAYGDADIVGKQIPWGPDDQGGCDVFISAVDNMDVRASLWNFYKDKCKFFLDGRMSAQVYKVYGVDTSNKEACAFYETTLFPQAKAAIEPCGNKSIIYTVSAVGAQMCSQVKRFLNKERIATEIVYDLFSDEITKKYHNEPQYEVFEAEEEIKVEEPNKEGCIAVA